MFSFFKKVLGVEPVQTDAGPTDFDHTVMSFEERKKWRREMVFKSLREMLLSLEVVAAMYKCRVSQVDQRGHRYIITMDIAENFSVGKRISINGFAGIEALVANNAFERYGVVVEGMYWRTNDAVNVFSNAQLGAQVVVTSVAKKKLLVQDFADTQPFYNEESEDAVVFDNRKEQRPVFTPVSKDEEEAFMAALRSGMQPKPIHVGKKIYTTDLAPLISGKAEYVDEDPDF